MVEIQNKIKQYFGGGALVVGKVENGMIHLYARGGTPSREIARIMMTPVEASGLSRLLAQAVDNNGCAVMSLLEPPQH